jgi:two-component system cell cycle sensor histidine kinase/response regulator CckA
MDLSAVVSGMEPRLREMIGANIALQFNLEREGLWVKPDPAQIEQVVVNLITNARDAMPQGGTITVETSRFVRSKGGESELAQLSMMPDGNYVRLVVRDTGIGMDADTKADCFSPFFTTKAKSIGLGLSTMYGIVKRSSGWVSLESEPGRGACFKVYLPEVGDP